MAAVLAWPAVGHAQVSAGVAAVDASWHVGASAGQYASDGTPISPEEGNYDPTTHSFRRAPSYGIQSRLSVRALVVQGPGGARVAVVKTDFYIPQDLVYRRAAQLLEAGSENEQGAPCGITRETFTMAASHDHSSPMYSSTSWGVWTFQDVFDIRFYTYMAERMAEAVERACDDLVPVRVGAAVGEFDKTHRHSFGPATADDGTPAGYPQSNTDHELTVIRFDDVSDPDHPEPLANLVNFSLHPEFLEGNDLISADYIGPLERMVDRGTDATMVWTQGAVGTSEPERSTYHSIHERLEFSHRDYAQAEYGAHLMAGAILDTWNEAGQPGSEIPFDTDFPVAMIDRWYPGPLSHPYPGVSNCRVDEGLETADPLLPVIGLPDCSTAEEGLASLSDLLGLPDPPDVPPPPIDPGLTTDDFETVCVPLPPGPCGDLPENYSAPSYTGLEEDIDVHLQAIRFGDILLPICSCEQWFDQSENIESRTDTVVGDEHLGYEWQCTPNGDGTHEPDGSGTGTWSCPNADPSDPVTDFEYQRMRAQVNNPANGWNEIGYIFQAEGEPNPVDEIKGNYTHDDRCGPTALTPGDQPCDPGTTPVSADLGYALTVPISMANDYNGYIATYREYQRGDHYRKALTGWGPHSSDYMATRLVYMGRQLKDPGVVLPLDQVEEQPLVAKATADTQFNDARAAALGTVGGGAIAAYEAGLPDDGGQPAAISQPTDVERFGAAFFTWNGGSNFTDNPQVRVERLTGAQWEPYADQSGEIPVTLEFPEGPDTASYATGSHEWHWTAHFEAFVSPFPTGAPSDSGTGPQATPAGTYRFVVDGMRRQGGQPVPYHLESQQFEVRPWSGILVEDFRLEPDNTMSFTIGPRHVYQVTGGDLGVGGPDISAEIGPIDYPDSYDSPIPFIRERRSFRRDPAAPGDAAQLEWYCFTCSFRPWIDAGDADAAEVRILDVSDGSIDVVPATEQPNGRWSTQRRLGETEIASVAVGGVEDEWANYNGAAAGPLFLGSEPPQPPTVEPPVVPPIEQPEPPTPVPPGNPPQECGETQTGTDAPDTILGALGSQLILGLGGNDQVEGGAGDDCLFGGAGDDQLSGEGGDDLLEGEDGSDVLRGGDDGDRLNGGAASDVVLGGAGDDFVESRANGRDLVRCGPGHDRALVGKIDRVSGCEVVRRGP